MSFASCSTCPDDSAVVLPVTPTPPPSTEAHWPAVASLALGVFGLVTAEFLPASLLTAMAADLGVSEGAAGQTVTATALVGFWSMAAALAMRLVPDHLFARAMSFVLTGVSVAAV